MAETSSSICDFRRSKRSPSARWRGGAPRRSAECRSRTTTSGLAAFKEYLARATPTCRSHIMVDAVEEDYRFETLPHSYGSRPRADGRAQAEAALPQHALHAARGGTAARPASAATTAISSPRSPIPSSSPTGCRRSSRAELPRRGRLPAADGERGAAREARASRRPNLLVVAQHTGGLRLTFFRDRQFRLSPPHARRQRPRPTTRARYFAEEISNTRLYLHALRTADARRAPDGAAARPQRRAGRGRRRTSRARIPSLDCVRVGRRELAARLGIAEPLLDISPYASTCSSWGSRRPAEQPRAGHGDGRLPALPRAPRHLRRLRRGRGRRRPSGPAPTSTRCSATRARRRTPRARRPS